MAGTSYTTLPSNSYLTLGSQGDLYHSANYGTYDAGIGSLTSHPYQYQTTNYGTHLTDTQHQPSYSNDYLQSTYANGGHSTQQPQYHPTDRYAPKSTYNQDPSVNDYTNSQTSRHNHDRSTIPNNQNGNYAAANINTAQPPRKTTVDNHHIESNNQHQASHADTTHHHPPVPTDDQHHQSQAPPSQKNHVPSEHNTSNHPPSPPPPKQQRFQSQPPGRSNHARSEYQNSKQSPPAHRSPSNGGSDLRSATTTKTNNPPPEMKTTKSSQMRAQAIKQKGETREQKQKDGNFPSMKKKPTSPKAQPQPPPPPVQPSPSDTEENKNKKSKQKKKHSHSVPKHHKNRRDDYQTEENNTSADEDNHEQHTRTKSKKRTAFSDSHHDKHPSLPPVRRGRGPPYYDPPYDYPYPPVIPPPRGRYPYYDDYPPYPYSSRYDHRYRHLYEDPYEASSYVAPYHDPYDGLFDYEKPKSKPKKNKHKHKKEHNTDHEDHDAVTANETEHEDDTKSQQSKKSKNPKHSHKDDGHETDENARPHKYYDAPYYDEPNMLEAWRQERNDFLKKQFKPTVHDVLYSQQRMKSDSYLENQRRRALRESQGYYFPYKKYTLKDYKDLQKNEAQHNPYAPINEPTLDRKTRARKRQEYAAHIEKQALDVSVGGQQKTPRDMPPKKPWHLNLGDPQDLDKLSKRERALEYAKVQVIKNRPQKAPKNRTAETDPTEHYVNSLFPQGNNDGEGSVNERDNQSSDEDDQ